MLIAHRQRPNTNVNLCDLASGSGQILAKVYHRSLQPSFLAPLTRVLFHLLEQLSKQCQRDQ